MDEYKYLKYKNKYINAKHDNENQLGGLFSYNRNDNSDIESRLRDIMLNKLNDIILTKLSASVNEDKDILTNIFNHVNSQIEILKKPTNNLWKNCYNTCFINLKILINIEIDSTYYFINTIKNSVLTSVDNSKIDLIYDKQHEFDGNFLNDCEYIKLPDSLINDRKHLIMCFGPSASGKTFWVKNIISLLHKLDNTLPQYYLSIDGDIYRKTSIIYGMILDSIVKNKLHGINNLVSNKFLFPSLFNARNVKNYTLYYLKKTNTTLSLYVPDTISDCVKCKKKIKWYYQFVFENEEIDDLKWTALNVWQHQTKNECPYNEQFKCMGCSASGKSREIHEGKKYSPDTWNISYRNARNIIINKKNGYSLSIHNSGTSDKITGIIDYSTYTDNIAPDRMNTFAENSITHINNEIRINYVYRHNDDKYNTIYKNLLQIMGVKYKLDESLLKFENYPNENTTKTENIFTDYISKILKK